MRHALRAVDHGVEERATNTNRSSTKGDCLKYIRGAADTTVDHELEARAVRPEQKVVLLQGLDDLGEDRNTSWGKVKLASAVVGQHHAIDTSLGSQHCVLPALDTLEKDLHVASGGDELGDVLPAQAWVDEGRDRTRSTTVTLDIVAVLVLLARRRALELGAHVLVSA